MDAHSEGGSILCTQLGADVPVCILVWVFLFFSGGGVYPDVHIWKGVHACAHVLSIQFGMCTSG